MDANIERATIGLLLKEVSRKRASNVFVGCGEKSRTYAELDERVDGIARGLLACGVGKGDKVALWAGNSIEWVECYLAVVSIGGVLVTVNTRYHASEFAYQLAQSDTKFLICQERFLKEGLLERVLAVVPELRTQEFGAVANEEFPLFKGVILLGDASAPIRGACPFDVLMERGLAVDAKALGEAQAAVEPDDVALMIYTSGTTGSPKGVEQQHFALLNRMYRYCRYNGMGEDDATFFALPLFHSFGAVVAVLGTLVTGSRLCLLEKFRAREALELIERERCSVIHGVPSSFYMMLRDPDFDRFDLSCGRTGVLGGSFCPPDLAQEVMDKIAPGITNAWGQTESCGMVTASAANDTAEQVCTTIGRVIDGSEVLICDCETGREVAPGEHGEIVVKSAYNMKGYYHMPEATAEVLVDGCLHTGDVGYFDSDGCLRIDGRLKDMYIVGGVNTYPNGIERVIRSLPGVADVQVVGVPDERLGEVGCAFVIKEPDSGIIEDDVIGGCSDLANYEIPRYVRFVEEFPLTANGKVKKYLLKEMYESSQ